MNTPLQLGLHKTSQPTVVRRRGSGRLEIRAQSASDEQAAEIVPLPLHEGESEDLPVTNSSLSQLELHSAQGSAAASLSDSERRQPSKNKGAAATRSKAGHNKKNTQDEKGKTPLAILERHTDNGASLNGAGHSPPHQKQPWRGAQLPTCAL